MPQFFFSKLLTSRTPPLHPSELQPRTRVLVNSIRDDEAASWRALRWWKGTARSIISHESILLYHVYRETNQLADSLANFVVHSRQNDVFWGAHNLPHPCKGPMVIDKSGLMHVRMV
ncbi:hypothetical protein Taro_046800 [Colocasia esculenta]|uniref:RNase H type-1 domain-containing protein n=1 Tax=Colocasia esculenta TaxID=4460 RepID=A0A843WR02_COLES|nr:hypothetical protein [Colocasia esculenta]